jgi:hypothetical protein
VLKGKFGYMSPEQAEGRRLDARSDVFSAGIVLHELLTGRRLFYGKDDLEILRKVSHGDILDPRKYAPGAPEDLVAVVNRGLAREVDRRYQSAGEMADALDVIIAAHDIADSVLSELMSSLLGPKPTVASARMKRRRKKMTRLAWQQGVRERDSVRLRPVSGVLGGADAEETSAGRRTASRLDELELENDTLITTDVRWMAPEQVGDDVEAVLSEQDQASAEEFAAVLLANKTQILREEDDVAPDAVASAEPAPGDHETEDLDRDVAPGESLELSAQQTEILDTSGEDSIGLSEQKTGLLDSESPGGDESAVSLLESSTSAPTVAQLEATAIAARKRFTRKLLAITAVVAVVVVVLVIMKLT